jgi:histidinol-phosphate aminotransferase
MPAYGNFVTFKLTDAQKVYEQLLEKGIILRPLKPYGLGEWLRVSVGLPAENERFLEALGQLLAV